MGRYVIVRSDEKPGDYYSRISTDSLEEAKVLCDKESHS